MTSYKCGCPVPAGAHPSACPLHGRIVDEMPKTPDVPLYPVLFTREELVSLGRWLRGQTFPYDEENVHTAAARITKVTSEA